MARRKNHSKQTKCVLCALWENANIWRYGYDLCKATGLKSGTIYPILMRLHDQGFLEASWRDAERPGRPARHVYRLSAAGKALAHEAALEINHTAPQALKPALHGMGECG